MYWKACSPKIVFILHHTTTPLIKCPNCKPQQIAGSKWRNTKLPHTSMGPPQVDHTHPCFMYEHVATMYGGNRATFYTTTYQHGATKCGPYTPMHTSMWPPDTVGRKTCFDCHIPAWGHFQWNKYTHSH